MKLIFIMKSLSGLRLKLHKHLNNKIAIFRQLIYNISPNKKLLKILSEYLDA